MELYTPQLRALGWTPFFASAFQDLHDDDSSPGRVVLVHRARLRVDLGSKETDAILPGRLQRLAEHDPSQCPAIGDWLAVRLRDPGAPAIVEAVLPRTGTLSRKEAGRRTREQVVAANVDRVFVVMGLDADFSLRRLERMLTMTWDSGAQPVVVLNKCDAVEDAAERHEAARAVAPGADVVSISARDGHGVEALTPFLEPGTTIALVGSSGVGKSTLINRLLGRDALATGAVRNRDGRGQHTTTHRQLLRLPTGVSIIDNPGVRELQLWGASRPAGERGLDATFDELTDIAHGCRFRDCHHRGEPGCAVETAVTEGRLARDRLTSHHALEKELTHLALREDALARRVATRKTAAIHKAAKAFKKRF